MLSEETLCRTQAQSPPRWVMVGSAYGCVWVNHSAELKIPSTNLPPNKPVSSKQSGFQQFKPQTTPVLPGNLRWQSRNQGLGSSQKMARRFSAKNNRTRNWVSHTEQTRARLSQHQLQFPFKIGLASAFSRAGRAWGESSARMAFEGKLDNTKIRTEGKCLGSPTVVIDSPHSSLHSALS